MVLAKKLANTGTLAQTTIISKWGYLLRLINDVELPNPLVKVVNLFGNFETSSETWHLSGLAGKVTELIWNAHLRVRTEEVLVIDDSSVAALSHRYPDQLVAQPIRLVTPAGDVVTVRVPADST